MKLKRLAINRLPGINKPFEIETAGAGFHVVYGPNGIGKSSICRAVESLYWKDRGPSQRISINGEFESDGEKWWGEREGARVQWRRDGENSVPPNLPPSHHHQCFFLRLRDLIDPSPDGTRDIASDIRRQMSGGFDLDRIASDLFADMSLRRGRRERKQFNEASDNVRKVESSQLNLQGRADQLKTLATKLHEADTNARRLASVDRALGLADRLMRQANIKEQIAVLPEALASLTGKEVERVEQFQVQFDEFTERGRTLQGQLSEARDVRQNSELSTPIDQPELVAWREYADELRQVELELKAKKSDHIACRNELAAALSAIGNGNVDEAALNLAQHSNLFEFLRSSGAYNAEVDAINERMRLLERVNQLGDDQRNPERTREAAAVLRAWLCAPEPETLSDKIRARRSWILLACVMAVAGVGLAVFIDPLFALFAAAGTGIVLPVFMLDNQKTSSRERKTRQDEFEKHGVAEPDAWEIPSVATRLHSLENETAKFNADLQRARDRGVEQQTLINKLEGLSETKAALEARRQELTDSLNLDVTMLDAELVDFARALDLHRSARSKEQSAAGEVYALEARHNDLLTSLGDILECHGELRPEDAATATARLNNLADRNSRLVGAISDEQQATNQLEQVSADQDATLKSIRQMYSEAALNEGDFHGLKTLLDLLPQYQILKDTAAHLEGQIDLDRAELAKVSETELSERDGLSLERLKNELSKATDEAARLRDEIAEINNQVKEAKRSSNVLNLLALRDAARTKLQDYRDEVLFAKAGQFLINAVEEEYEQIQMPRVFERARDHLSVFTRHNYKLNLGKEDKEPRLFATELRVGEVRELDELSDGTRTQLLLAARLAFAEEVEQGKILPLFFDEALDQSDPTRFEAIIRSLGRVAIDQGRQIFYLTSDPLDLERIREALAEEDCTVAAEIDLRLVRMNKASISGSPALHVSQRPTVPTPNGQSVEEYGATLCVPEFLPALGYMEQHFFYVLSDDLELLHDFLAHDVERAGQWQTVSGTPLADKLNSRSISPQQIEFRLDLLQFFCELWKQGRGRPVDRDAIEACKALSNRFLDDVVAIAEELNGKPEELIATLRAKNDSRIRGFRQNSLDGLEQYLRENGYLDAQSILNENELRIRALSSPAANNLPEGVASDCLNRWWTWAVKSSNPVPQQ